MCLFGQFVLLEMNCVIAGVLISNDSIRQFKVEDQAKGDRNCPVEDS